jgi:hypothetical protein
VGRIAAHRVELALVEQRQAEPLGIRGLAATVDERDLGLRVDPEVAQRDPRIHVRAALAVAAQALALELRWVLDLRSRDEDVRRVVGD